MTTQPRWGSRSARGAAPAEDLAGAARRADQALPAVENGQHLGLGLRGRHGRARARHGGRRRPRHGGRRRTRRGRRGRCRSSSVAPCSPGSPWWAAAIGPGRAGEPRRCGLRNRVRSRRRGRRRGGRRRRGRSRGRAARHRARDRAPWRRAARRGRRRSRLGRGEALVHRTERHDAGDVDGVEGIFLVANSRQVDDDVRPLDPHVGLGDAASLELVTDQVADDQQVVTGGAPSVGARVTDEPTLQVEAEGRSVAEGEVECENGDRHADDAATHAHSRRRIIGARRAVTRRCRRWTCPQSSRAVQACSWPPAPVRSCSPCPRSRRETAGSARLRRPPARPGPRRTR